MKAQLKKKEEWEVRQDFTKNDAILGRCFSDFDDEGHGCELSREKNNVGPPHLMERREQT